MQLDRVAACHGRSGVDGSSAPGQDVDVYPFGADSACNPLARTREDLEEQYPLGSAVTVVATSPPLSAGLRRSFVVDVNDWGSVARVPDSTPRTADGFLDFGAFARTYESHPEDGFSMPVAWRNTHRTSFEDFEYLRALVLLKGNPVQERRAAIVRNLQSYSRWRGINFDWARDQYRQLVRSARLPAREQKSLLRDFKKTGN